MMNKKFLVSVVIGGILPLSNAYADACPDGICWENWTCTCDSNGQVTETLNSSGTWKYIYTHDTDGNVLSTTAYSGAENIANNTPTGQWVSTFDSNRNQLSSTYYEGAENIASKTSNQHMLFTYDANGNETSYTAYFSAANIANDTPDRQYRRTYDANGNETSVTYYSGAYNIANNIPSYQYTYCDELGNYNGIENYRDCTTENCDSIVVICVTGYVSGCIKDPSLLEDNSSSTNEPIDTSAVLKKFRKIYTVEEAIAALGTLGRNTFILRYR